MKTQSYIDQVEFFVPPTRLSNEELVEENPSWEVDKIYEKTGIKNFLIGESLLNSSNPAELMKRFKEISQ